VESSVPVEEARVPEVGHTIDQFVGKGFGGEGGFGTRPAVLLIDLIRGFTDPASPLGSPMDEVVANADRLAAAARRIGAPVVLLATRYGRFELEAGVFGRKIPGLAVLRVGSAWVEIDPRIAVSERDVVLEKKMASAFFGTPLASLLTGAGIDSVLLAGATTSGCIRASAVDAVSHGFATLVVADAVADRAAESHRVNLADMAAKYADLVSTTDAIRLLDALGGRA
jgi:nicotinamidase-related amidase